MKTTRFAPSLISAAILLGAASSTLAQNGNGQSGGLPALAAEVAALRAQVAALQEQVGGNDDPYVGTYTVTAVETALFGCRQVNNDPPPSYVAPYFLPNKNSSIAVRSAFFDVEADGSTLVIPEFEMFTQELRLSGFYEQSMETDDGGVEIDIGGDGSLSAEFEDDVVKGQFSDDGSMFTALIVGQEQSSVPGQCDDAWTVHVVGVRQ